MTSTTIPAAKQAIFDAVRNQITDGAVLVVYSQPGVDHPNDIVAVGNVRRTTKPVTFIGSGGDGWIEETYRVDVVVSVFRSGDDFQGTEWAAWDLIADIEAAVRTDPSLGGVVIAAYPEASTLEAGWSADHKGVLAEGDCTIFCTARI
jgi:hypothetical protein